MTNWHLSLIEGLKQDVIKAYNLGGHLNV